LTRETQIVANIFRHEALAHQTASRTPEPLAPLVIVTGARAIGWVATFAACVGLVVVSILRVPCVATGVVLAPVRAGEHFEVAVLTSSPLPPSFAAASARVSGVCTAVLGRERTTVSLRFTSEGHTTAPALAITGAAKANLPAGAAVSLECGAESLAAALMGRR
jgi:hypothetical protein